MSQKHKGKKPSAEKTAAEKTAAKKAAVMGTGKKSRTPLYVMIACAVVVLGGAYLFIGRGAGDAPAVAASTQSSSGGEITLSAAEFNDGRAKYYQYDGGNGVAIRYFVVKASDGSIRTAFDRCDTCWSSGKGYKQDGNVMVCQNCGRRFTTTEIGLVYGGCNPAPLKSQTRGANVVITGKDIMEGRPYFDLPRRG